MTDLRSAIEGAEVGLSAKSFVGCCLKRVDAVAYGRGQCVILEARG